MPAKIKFCGLTRSQDAALGAALGASYLGVVFAPSPRRVDVEQACKVFADIPAALSGGPKRVGVFANVALADITRMALDARLDVVQLHGDPSPGDVRSLSAAFTGEIWAARRLADSVPADLMELAECADAVLIDSRSGTALGGTGTTFSWEAVAPQLELFRDHVRLVVAGGLTPDNVRHAIELLDPSVVDVSSGVERAPGVKDETLMRAFARAVGVPSK